MALRNFNRMGAKPTIIEHEGKQYIPMLRYQTGVEGQDGFQEGDAYLDGIKAAGYQKMGGLRAVKAAGGSVDGAAPDWSGHPEFQNWFGASKAVDEGGSPLVLYHGTNQPIDAFDPKRGGSATGENAGATKGFFFTDSKDVAQQYADRAGRTLVPNAAFHERESQRLQREAARHEAKGDWDAYEKAMMAWEDHEAKGVNASDDEGKNIVHAHLSIQNPMVLDFGGGRLSADRDLDSLIDKAKAAGHDGMILKNLEDSPQMGIVSNHYVAFHPHQIKSVNNSGRFNPKDPRIHRAAGGAAMFEGIHPDLQDEQGNPRELWHGTPGEGFDAFSDDKLGSRDAGFFGRGHYLTPSKYIAEAYAGDEGSTMGPLHAALKNPFVWDMSEDNKAYRTKKDLETMGIKREGKLDPWRNLQPHEIDTFMDHMDQRGHDGVLVKGNKGLSEVVVFKPNAIKHKDAEVFDPNDPRIMRATGGRTLTRHGLYSKAAEIIRSLPQEKGTVDQYIAAAKARGAKPAELDHAGRPEGDKITREEMAKHFDSRLPNLKVEQYGENPAYLTRPENRERIDLQSRAHDPMQKNPLSDDEQSRFDMLTRRVSSGPSVETYEDDDTGEESPRPTQYEDYALPGGTDYRERLLRLPAKGGSSDYKSSHWAGHPNVLAHIRLQDRVMGPTSSFAEAKKWVTPVVQKIADHMGTTVADLGSGSASYAVKNGLITPEEAATLTKIKGWRNEYEGKPGIDKRVLHVEELQSDWAQEGRDKGFHDAKNPYEVFDKKTKELVSKHPSYEEMWDAYRKHPNSDNLDYGYAGMDKPPTAPYVQNTQHWTDLALKNVLREAAAGNYDHVVFTPGQAQADRYGLEKQVDSIGYHPATQQLTAFRNNQPIIQRSDVGPDEVRGLIGKDMSERLMHPDNAVDLGGGDMFHSLAGDDLKMGGDGMKGYYDNIVPKSVMRLAQQHDPDIQPGSMQITDSHAGFSIPMTDKLKQGVLGGQTAFKRGGAVDVDKALAATRSFTKDGRAAMMRLKD
jgi:hypothetical protein